jgi:hypothetical protein
VLTSVTTASTTTTVGPFTTDGNVATSDTFGGFANLQICNDLFGTAIRNWTHRASRACDCCTP